MGTTVKKTEAKTGVSTMSLLGVAFVVLKLTGVVSWSWWWVTCPFWGGFAIVGGVAAMIGVVYGFVLLVEKLLR